VPPGRYYVDTSAFIKLLVPELESRALDAAIGPDDRLVSSDLLKVEAVRVLGRLGSLVRARPEHALDRVSLVRISVSVRDRASTIGPPSLRALDAIHLATADELRADLDALLTYDERLIHAAGAVGIPVLSPA
jgi:uncharacterized protein